MICAIYSGGDNIGSTARVYRHTIYAHTCIYIHLPRVCVVSAGLGIQLINAFV